MSMNWVNILNKHTEKVLDANEHMCGSFPHQWELHDQDNQKWCITPVPNYDGFYITTLNSETDECFFLEVCSASTGNELIGSRLKLSSASKDILTSTSQPSLNKPQVWHLRGVEPGWYHLVSAMSTPT